MPVFHDRQAADLLRDQDTGCLVDVCIRCDREGFGGHEEAKLGLFRLAEQILPGDDTDNLLMLYDRDTGNTRSFEYLQDIVAVPGDLDMDDVRSHVISDFVIGPQYLESEEFGRLSPITK